MRLGVVYALLAVVVGEMISARMGLGQRIAFYAASFRAEGVLGTILVLAMIGLALQFRGRACRGDTAALEGRGDMRLAGKVALITGAASGMGAAEARLFAREGAAVALADMLVEPGLALAAEIKEAGGKAIFLVLDVTDDAAWQATVGTVVDRLGRLDILVNNAGISTTGADVPMSEARMGSAHGRQCQGRFPGPAPLRAGDAAGRGRHRGEHRLDRRVQGPGRACIRPMARLRRRSSV